MAPEHNDVADGATASDPGPLRSVIESARAEHGASLKYFTVLSAQIDPYRIDTPANHAVGRWFAEQMDRLGLLHRRIHLRGIHYALLGSTTKPSSEPYINTDENWQWLQNSAAKAARWLRYVPFSAITDARNATPQISDSPDDEPSEIDPWLSWGGHIEHPSFYGLKPHVTVTGFERNQPYRLALYGEKTSLQQVLDPIARQYGADLFLPTGEISDTQMHQMAEAAAEDGRPLIVFTVTDFDPAGWQMSVSIGRKLQALKDLLFPDLEFELHPVALTLEQVRDLDLPSTPLKETERRGDKWRECMGWEQTEIDSLATLRPQELRRIVTNALGHYYDTTLYSRLQSAKTAWGNEANRALNEQLDHNRITDINERVDDEIDDINERLGELEEEMAEASLGVRIDYPAASIPGPSIDEALQPRPLISSEWSWSEQTRALRRRKDYAE